MSQTLTIPSESPVARSVPVWSIADVTTGAVCGFNVRARWVVISDGEDRSRANIRIDREREHIIRCDADGVTGDGSALDISYAVQKLLTCERCNDLTVLYTWSIL